MTFTTPIPALIAAAIALPALLLLYFLKLRRMPQTIASTMLWRKTIEDLQVNAPFQRIRLSLLFLLQLLLLLSLLFAMAGPVIDAGESESQQVILLIDRSGSMNARDGDDETSRLDEAKAAARDIIDSLGGSDSPDEMMIIAYAARPSVVSGFQSDKRLLRNALAGLEPTDAEGNLQEALELANAFSGSASDEAAALPRVVIMSDAAPPTSTDSTPGSTRNASRRSGAGYSVQASDVRFVRIGPEADTEAVNLGITDFNARRRYDDPTNVDLFIRVVSSSAQPRTTALTIRADDRTLRTESVDVSAATPEAAGEGVVDLSFEIPGGALISASIGIDDALASDNAAAVVLPDPAPPRILAVAPGRTMDVYLRAGLEAFEPDLLNTMSRDEYAATDIAQRVIDDRIDFLVFDRVSPAALPPAPSLTVGAAPPETETRAASHEGGRRILSWDRRTPVMRGVALDSVVFSNFGGFVLPDDAESLARGPDGPVIAQITSPAGPHVFIGFELGYSNWPIDPSMLVFMQNVLEQASLGAEAMQGRSARPGQTVTVRADPAVPELTVRRASDDAAIATVEPNGRARVSLPILQRAGVYVIEGALPPQDRLAVNVASVEVTDIRPGDDLIVNAERVEAVSADRAAPQELWPWFLLCGLVLLVLEWLVYTWRVRR